MSDIKDRYMFVSQENEDFASIMIKDGKFKNVIYNYGKVSIPEEDNLNEDGTLTIVISSLNPDMPNWIETAGHEQGTMLLRWVGAEEHPVPYSEVKKISALK